MEAFTNILLIEDNPGDVRLIEEYLKDSDVRRYKLFHSSTLAGGKELLASQPIDIVLLDLYLPDSLGEETFDTLFREYASYPFIVLTGLADEAVGIRAVKKGAQDFLSKNELNHLLLSRAIRYGKERHQMLRRLEQAQHLSQMSNWELDLETNELYCGQYVYAILGQPQGTIFHSFEDYIDIVYEEDRQLVKSAFQHALDQASSFKVDHRVSLPDGTFKSITLQGQAETDSLNRLQRLVGTLQDITDRKEVEKLIREKELAVRGARLRQEFLANTSHEIRTPLHGILQLTTILLKEDPRPEQEEYLKLISHAGGTLLAVVNDVLDLSKIEANKIDFAHTTFNLQQLISSMVDMLELRAKEDRLQLSTTIDPEIPEFLVGDPVRLNQVLINLVSNAIKFTERGFVKLSVRKKTEEQDRVILEFSIQDSGIGIPEDKLNVIFESFQRLDTDLNRRSIGTGLGLTIVEQLVKLQGGNISVTSQEGQGSNFTFTLPLQVSRQEDVTKAKDQASHLTGEGLNGIRILVVEDNPLNQLVTDKLLQDWGVIVDIANDGQECLDMLKQSTYDIILMDLQMPVMDGYTATRYIREQFQAPKREIPIIALTANAFSGMDDEVLKVGMDDYISKPFEVDVLFQKIVHNLNQQDKSPHYMHTPSTHTPSLVSTNGNSHVHTAPVVTLPITDLKYLQKVSGGDTRIIKLAIGKFLENTPEMLSQLDQLVGTQTHLELSRVAHKLKSSVATMGMDSVKEIAATIEHLAREEEKLDQLPGLVKDMRKYVELGFTELRQQLAQIS